MLHAHCTTGADVIIMWAVKIGHAIRHYRRLAGLTQSELATRAELDQGNLSRLERGLQDVPTETLERISKELGVRASDVWRYAEDGNDRDAMLRQIIDSMSVDDKDAAIRLLTPRMPAKSNGN